MTRRHDENLDKQSYEIKDELKIRKEIEALTDWNVELTKNPDKYEYDMQFYRWDDDPSGPDARKLGGFIELEHASEESNYPWYNEDPPDEWSFISFLKRKVLEYDWDAGAWQGLKDEHHRTVYMKWNIPMTNCFVAPITEICREGKTTPHSDGSYNNSYFKLWYNSPDDCHPAITFGPRECVEFVEEYLSNCDDGQQSLLSFESSVGAVEPDGGSEHADPDGGATVLKEVNARYPFVCDGCKSPSNHGIWRKLKQTGRSEPDEYTLCGDCSVSDRYGGDA